MPVTFYLVSHRRDGDGPYLGISLDLAHAQQIARDHFALLHECRTNAITMQQIEDHTMGRLDPSYQPGLYYDQRKNHRGETVGRALRKGDTIANSIPGGTIDPTDPRRWTLLHDPVRTDGTFAPQDVRATYSGPKIGADGRYSDEIETSEVDLLLSAFAICGIGYVRIVGGAE